MNYSELPARDLGRDAARAADHRARHRAEAIALLATRRRARLRALAVHLGRPRTAVTQPRPVADPCPETPKAAA